MTGRCRPRGDLRVHLWHQVAVLGLSQYARSAGRHERL